jgi:hypothetical protein
MLVLNPVKLLNPFAEDCVSLSMDVATNLKNNLGGSLPLTPVNKFKPSKQVIMVKKRRLL